MAKLLINIGQSPNDKSGDPLRTAFSKVNANFNELYSAIGADVQIPIQTGNSGKYLTTNGTTLSWGTVSSGATDRIVSGDSELVIIHDQYGGSVVFPTHDNGKIGIQGIEIGAFPADPENPTPVPLVLTSFNGEVWISSNAAGPRPLWNFDQTGTINVPVPEGGTFTLTLSSEHFVPRSGKSSLTLSGDPWVFHGAIVRTADGRADLQLDAGPFPSLVNPGYVTGDEFTFSDQVHHLFGYSLTIVLDEVVQAGPAGWTASLLASQLPAYPSTVRSTGAIKLTADTSSLTFGTNGSLYLPNGATFTPQDTGGIDIVAGPGVDSYSGLTYGYRNWMYVNTDAAYIETSDGYTGKSWSFTNDGKLHLPVGGDIVDSLGVSVLGGGNANASVTTGITAPVNPITGDLWYDAVGGRMYVYYDNNWVDTSPVPNQTSIDSLVNGSYTLSIGVDGTINLPELSSVSLLQSTKSIQLNANGKFWSFDIDGNVTLPPGGDIRNSTGSTVLGGGASTGDLRFTGTAMYALGGVIVENADLSHGATAALLLPTNGSSDPIQLNNTYGDIRLLTIERSTTNRVYVNGVGNEFTTDVEISPGIIMQGWSQRNPIQIEVDLFISPAPIIADFTSLSIGSTVVVTYSTPSGNQTFTSTLEQQFTAVYGQVDPLTNGTRYSGRIGGTLPSDQTGIISINLPVYSANNKNWQFNRDGSTVFPNGSKLDGGTPNKFATDQSVTNYVDLRDVDGRGFYTDNNGFSLRSNGSNTWNFSTSGVLTLPNGNPTISAPDNNLTINAANYVYVDSLGNGQIEIGTGSGIGAVVLGSTTKDVVLRTRLVLENSTSDIVNTNGETVLGFASTSYSLSTVNSTILAGATTSGFTVNGDATVTFAAGTEIQFESLAGAEFTVGSSSYDGGFNLTTVFITDYTGFGPVDGDKIYLEYHGVQEIYAGSNIALGVTEGNSGRVLTIAADLSNITPERQFLIMTETFNAVSGYRYAVNTTSGPITANLPLTPQLGDAIFFVDSHGNFPNDNLTIDGGGLLDGKTIMGLGSQLISTANESIGVFYNGTEWRFYS